VVVHLLSGTALVKAKAAGRFSPLAQPMVLPLGSRVDTAHGSITLTSVPKRGGTPQTVTLSGGAFTVTQPGGVTDLALPGGACRKGRTTARSLTAEGRGAFRITGARASATGRDGKWVVQDTCAGTRVRAVRGTVSVADAGRHRTVRVRAGHAYLARAPRR
jgi:hypothetical protein